MRIALHCSILFPLCLCTPLCSLWGLRSPTYISLHSLLEETLVEHAVSLLRPLFYPPLPCKPALQKRAKRHQKPPPHTHTPAGEGVSGLMEPSLRRSLLLFILGTNTLVPALQFSSPKGQSMGNGPILDEDH